MNVSGKHSLAHAQVNPTIILFKPHPNSREYSRSRFKPMTNQVIVPKLTRYQLSFSAWIGFSNLYKFVCQPTKMMQNERKFFQKLWYHNFNRNCRFEKFVMPKTMPVDSRQFVISKTQNVKQSSFFRSRNNIWYCLLSDITLAFILIFMSTSPMQLQN